MIKTTQEGVDAADLETHAPPPPDVTSVEGIVVGMRCEVYPGQRRGTVRFVGEIAATGYWVGVQFDEPVGRNDGTVKGTYIIINIYYFYFYFYCYYYCYYYYHYHNKNSNNKWEKNLYTYTK